jgi:hypothetical protein
LNLIFYHPLKQPHPTPPVMMNRTSENDSPPEDFTPLREDIICGRGCAYSTRPGNRMFSAIVQEHLEEYTNAPSRLDKTMVVAVVLNKILETGARFVKKEKGKTKNMWCQMTREEAHHKTGHAIRDTIRQMEKSTTIAKTASDMKVGTSKTTIHQHKVNVGAERRPASCESSLFNSFFNLAPASLIMENGDRAAFGSSTSNLFEPLLDQEGSTTSHGVSVSPLPNGDNEPLPISSFTRSKTTFVSLEDLYQTKPILMNDFDDTPIQAFNDNEPILLESAAHMQTVCDILLS